MIVSRTKLGGIALVIFAVTVWLFWPSVHGDFLAGDDVEYLRQSERWNGLTWNAVRWAFTSTDSYYHPLVRLSHVLDYQIFGRNPAGHHATSVVVHGLNAGLVFGFLWTLLGATSLSTDERLTLAVWVTAVFAVHPLQTESVAFMSGRTQLLCTTFGIASLWAYAAGVRRWVVWGLYVAALLCKPMAVSFPFVMLAMDYYPLRRSAQLGWSRLIREKAPWIALAVASSVATVISKSQLGDVIPLETVRPSFRVFLALKNLTFYPLKLVWPSHLSPTYLVPASISIDDWAVSGPVLIVVMITAFAVVERRRAPILAAAWGAYIVLVLPVSGLMLTVPQAVATRFAYVAILPLLLLGGGTAAWVWRRSATAARVALIGLLAAQLCAFGVHTRSLVPVWRNDETKADAVLADSPDTEEGNRTVTSVLLDRGRASEALPYAQRGVELAPQLWPAHMMLGLVLERLGQLSEAIAQYEQALRMNPDVVEVQYNCGVALAEAGRVPEAITHYQQALRLKPDYIHAHVNLGNALLRTGKVQEAVEQYEQALRIDPDSAEAHSNLGAVYQRMGKLPEAVQQYQLALQSEPDYVEAHYNLGLALEKLGRTPEAIQHYQQALKLRPEYTPARTALGRLGVGQ